MEQTGVSVAGRLGLGPGEGPLLGGLGAYFFVLIASYTTIKPATRSLVMETLGADWIAAIVVGTAILIGFVVLLVELLIDRTTRRHLLVGAAGFFMLCLLAFHVLMHSGIAPRVVDVAFYLWADIFSIVSVTLFWSFANDLVTPDQGKRLFGIVGAAGQTGAMLGGALSGWLTGFTGTRSLLLVSAGLLAVTIPLIGALDQGWAGEGEVERPDTPREPRRDAGAGIAGAGPGPKGGVTEGLRLIGASPYLLNIVVILGLSLMASQFVEQQFNKFVEVSIHGTDARTAYLGKRDVLMNVISVGIQLFLTGPILRRLGFTFALLLMPAADLATGLWILMSPGLTASMTAKICDACLKYGITQVTKETLYLPTRREVKYKAKAFIDMFFHRIVKGVAALSIVVSTELGHVGPAGLSWPVVLLGGLWIGAVLAIRKRYVEELTQRVRDLGREAGVQVNEPVPKPGREPLPDDAAIDAALGSARADGPATERLIVALAHKLGRPELTVAYALARGRGTARAIAREYLEQVIPARWRDNVLALAAMA